MIIVRACIWVALITLIDKQLYSSTGSQGGFSPLAKNYSGETNDFGETQKTNLVSPQPTRIGFSLVISLKFN